MYVGEGKKKHAQKSYKALATMKELNLGLDVNMDRVESLSMQALVSKFICTFIIHKQILSWVKVTWKPLVDYTLVVSILVNKWIHFHFLTESNLDMILSKPWVKGRGTLYATMVSCIMFENRATKS